MPERQNKDKLYSIITELIPKLNGLSQREFNEIISVLHRIREENSPIKIPLEQMKKYKAKDWDHLLVRF